MRLLTGATDGGEHQEGRAETPGRSGKMSFERMEATLESRNDIHATAEVVTETLALLWRLQIFSFTCEAHTSPPAQRRKPKKKANYLSINYLLELEWNKETHNSFIKSVLLLCAPLLLKIEV